MSPRTRATLWEVFAVVSQLAAIGYLCAAFWWAWRGDPDFGRAGYYGFISLLGQHVAKNAERNARVLGGSEPDAP